MYFLIIYSLIMFVTYFVTLPNILERLGKKKSDGYIPIYRIIQLLDGVKHPKWWIILFIFPGINVYMYIILTISTLRYFGFFDPKNTIIGILCPPASLYMLVSKYKEQPVFGLTDWSKQDQVDKRKWSDIICSIIPTLGFGILLTFLGNSRNKKGKTYIREVSEAIIFAFIAASIVRTYVFEPYQIPTPSMEKTMRTGDVLFVNKLALGPRIPITPFSIPLFHNNVPKLNVKSYIEAIQLPYMRVPGYSKLERNDPFVFNFPHGDTAIFDPRMPDGLMGHDYYGVVRGTAMNLYFKDLNRGKTKASWEKVSAKYEAKARQQYVDEYGLVYRPIDRRENYIKRCVGMPGDKLEIIDNILMINGEKAFQPEESMFDYVNADGTPVKLNKTLMKRFGSDPNWNPMPLTAAEAKEYSKVKNVNIKPARKEKPSSGLEMGLSYFPNHPDYNWTSTDFGPITIPAEGATVELTLENLPIYERIIDVYENHDIEVENGQILIDGEVATSYTFGQNYYWAMGDNRHHSADSRVWGFVPEDHIVTTVAFIWFSRGFDGGFLGFRGDRFFKGVE